MLQLFSIIQFLLSQLKIYFESNFQLCHFSFIYRLVALIFRRANVPHRTGMLKFGDTVLTVYQVQQAYLRVGKWQMTT